MRKVYAFIIINMMKGVITSHSMQGYIQFINLEMPIILSLKRFWVEGVLLTTISSIGVLGNIIS